MRIFLCFCICICISICTILLVGCGSVSSGVTPSETGDNSAVTTETEDSIVTTETENSTTVVHDSGQTAEISNWTPTTFSTVNNFEGVTMAAKEGTVSPTGLTLQFENKSDSDCIYGDYFLLEKSNNGAWYQVPVVIEGNYGFNSIGYSLTSGGDSEWAADWEWLYGSLDKGEYRVVKDILDFRGTGDYDTYYLAVEFSIK